MEDARHTVFFIKLLFHDIGHRRIVKTNHQIVIEIAARHAFLDATCENGFGTLVVSLVICLSKADHLLVFVQVREENGIDDRQSLYLEMEELDEYFQHSFVLQCNKKCGIPHS